MTVEHRDYTKYLRARADTDFVIGADKFEDLTINPVAETKQFHYFQNSQKTVVKRFVLKRTSLSEKICFVTLIKKKSGRFDPRFVFQINDLSKKSIEAVALPVTQGEERTVKARVDLEDCHEAFTQLLDFLSGCGEVEVASGQYAVITADQKQLLQQTIKASNKDDVVAAVRERFAHKLTEHDIIIMTKRKEALARFRRLLDDPAYLQQYRDWLREERRSSRPEDVWQHFFENNRWIFGYGLQLVACEGLDDRKLETVVVGNDLFDGAGKRIDGLLKTRGAVNRALFTEIKRHDIDLLESYERPGVFSPSKDLRGAVAQVQKTLHKVNLKVSSNFEQIADKNGDPSGEIVAFVKPRGVVIVGQLDQFSTEHGTNWEQFASFELYRQHQTGIEILTYDELYERARFIIEAG